MKERKNWMDLFVSILFFWFYLFYLFFKAFFNSINSLFFIIFLSIKVYSKEYFKVIGQITLLATERSMVWTK